MHDDPLSYLKKIDLKKMGPREIGLGVGVAALLVAAIGIGVRMKSEHDLAGEAQDNAVPVVALAKITPSADGQKLVLPGSVEAFNSAPIYARTGGYVRRWLVDIGDHVAAGQTLAEIDAPDVEQQLAQARADHQTALANLGLARTTAQRWSELLAHDAVSRQEADEKSGDLTAKTALASAQQANVNRLMVLKGFTRITAPFAGVVTSRSTQIGALIVAGNASSTPLFTVADVHSMRIYVKVPQAYGARIHPGMSAKLTLPDYAGRAFTAQLVRTAGAVDAQSGTELVELQADNRDGALKPGAFAQVELSLPATRGALLVPTSALIFRAAGMQVAVVDASGHVVLRSVKLGQDSGNVVEVVSGLIGNERVIDTPPDAIANGDQVRIASPESGKN